MSMDRSDVRVIKNAEQQRLNGAIVRYQLCSVQYNKISIRHLLVPVHTPDSNSSDGNSDYTDRI